MTETPIDSVETDLPPFCADGCGERVTAGLVFGKPRKYIRGHGPQAQAQGKKADTAPKLPVGQSPSIDDLKAAAQDPEEDRKPGKSAKTKRSRRVKTDTAVSVPPFRAGPIAAGMNKLYFRTGKFIRVMDRDIGMAVIESTRKESEDDVTVGEAWEELARTNPRIRAALLKLISGGSYTQLMMAHAPIFLAIIMKDSIKKHIPFMKLIEAALVDDGDGDGGGQPSDISAMLGGLSPEDAAQMAQMAQGMMAQMGFNMGRNPNGARTPDGVPEAGSDAA
jgi:hypothetical protein